MCVRGCVHVCVEECLCTLWQAQLRPVLKYICAGNYCCRGTFVAMLNDHAFFHSKSKAYSTQWSIDGNIPQSSSEPSLQSTSSSQKYDRGMQVPSRQRNSVELHRLLEAFMTLSTKKACQFHKNRPSVCPLTLAHCTVAKLKTDNQLTSRIGKVVNGSQSMAWNKQQKQPQHKHAKISHHQRWVTSPNYWT